jgi:hypothetical protein
MQENFTHCSLPPPKINSYNYYFQWVIHEKAAGAMLATATADQILGYIQAVCGEL